MYKSNLITNLNETKNKTLHFSENKWKYFIFKATVIISITRYYFLLQNNLINRFHSLRISIS